MSDKLETGLCFSGGGYRAALFSLGSLWRLNELGWLRKLDVLTSVSGGSILNGVLATRWSELDWSSNDANAVATNFEPLIARPLRALAGQTLDVSAGIEGLISLFDSIPDKLTKKYDEHLFHEARLDSIPHFEKGRTPRFIFYATSLQTGSSVRIEKKRLADYRLGEIPNPDLSVARVVCASSAFPPILSPVELKVEPHLWRDFPEGPAPLADRQDLKSRLLLTDGGVYDNMGLEAIWDRCKTVLVSDAGAPLQVDSTPPTEWTRQTIRVLDIITEQTRALRKRWLLQQYEQAHATPVQDATQLRGKLGTYWGITTPIDNYGLADSMTRDNETTRELRNIRTRLSEFTSREQGRLINWGYALADAGMRRYVIPQNSLPPPAWPVPEEPL